MNREEVPHNQPIKVALVNDYEVVIEGLRAVLAPYADRVNVVELDANSTVSEDVDIILFDTFGLDQELEVAVDELKMKWSADKVVLFTWPSERESAAALPENVFTVLPKTLTGDRLVEAFECIQHRARPAAVTQAATSRTKKRPDSDIEASDAGQRNWPGRSAGLTMREASMIALITQGLSNAEISEQTFLSPNSIKSYIRSAYRKMGVTRRSQAVLWGVENGFLQTRSRVTS